MSTDRKCPSCGGTMIFDPGWDRLLCQSCGYKEVIPELVSKIPVPELDFNSALKYASHDWGMETQIVQCSQCGGETINSKLLLSGKCPFCGSNTLLPVKEGEDVMAPNGIIPFKIREKRAKEIFKQWTKDLTLAPEKLAELANLGEFMGIYVPYFTFDTLTKNQYSGTFGRTSRNANDELQEARFKKSGTFDKQVDDFPVVASKVLASDALLVSAMSYWTREAKPYTSDALAGFPAEHYSVGLADAWIRAMNDVKPYLIKDAKELEFANVDHNVQISTQFYNVTYKYLLVPVWINAYTYNNNVYRIVINGQTGKIVGRWPASFKRFLGNIWGSSF